jgi:hypothetical protein
MTIIIISYQTLFLSINWAISHPLWADISLIFLQINFFLRTLWSIYKFLWTLSLQSRISWNRMLYIILTRLSWGECFLWTLWRVLLIESIVKSVISWRLLLTSYLTWFLIGLQTLLTWAWLSLLRTIKCVTSRKSTFADTYWILRRLKLLHGKRIRLVLNKRWNIWCPTSTPLRWLITLFP